VLRAIEQELRRITERCTACGECWSVCPAVELAGLDDLDFVDVQRQLLDFLSYPADNEIVRRRAWSCLECYRCQADVCPEGLSPLRIVELAKWRLRQISAAPAGYVDPAEDDSPHRRTVAGLPERDRQRLFGMARPARYVLFPGCNIYLQPEKLLTLLDIMDLLGEDLVVLSGLDHCCGTAHTFAGEAKYGLDCMNRLLDSLAGCEPEAVIFWCPTCLCRVNQNVGLVGRPNFELVSAAEFLAQRVDRLKLRETPMRATLHEPCKTAYLGLGNNGIRRVLMAVPGLELTEMARCGPEAVCCGSGGYEHYPRKTAELTRGRLAEAAATGADTLITHCHYCHQVFAPHEAGQPLGVEHSLTVLGRALGIERGDSLKA
jgi:Fe-S oxidoreductase